MRRTARLGALGAAFGSALALAGAAEPARPAAPADQPSWLDRLTSGKPAAGGKTFGDTPDRPPAAVAPLEPAALAAALRAEQDAWDRRLEVCHKLRVVGDETNDERLIRRANELEQQATALYHSRAARLGVKPKLRGQAAPAAAPASNPTRTFKVVTP